MNASSDSQLNSKKQRQLRKLHNLNLKRLLERGATEVLMDNIAKLILRITFLTSITVSLVFIATVGIVWWDISPLFSIIFCTVGALGTCTSMLIAYIFAEENTR